MGDVELVFVGWDGEGVSSALGRTSSGGRYNQRLPWATTTNAVMNGARNEAARWARCMMRSVMVSMTPVGPAASARWGSGGSEGTRVCRRSAYRDNPDDGTRGY
jgi:hypothetical protein